MLPWRHKDRHKLYVWSKLVALSVTAHAVLILYLCFIYDNAPTAYHMTIGDMSPHSTVVFLPLQKVVRKKQVVAARPAAVQSPAQPAIRQQSKAVALPKKQKARLKVASRRVPVPKKSDKKIAQQEPVKKERVIAPENSDTKITPPVQAAAPVSAVEQPIVAEQQQAPASEDVVLYVGRVDVEIMKIQEQICHEIAKRWKPPRGLARNMVCDIKVVVGWNGKVERAVIDKASGVLAYDVNARTVVQSMEFPKTVWGKELVLHFKQ